MGNDKYKEAVSLYVALQMSPFALVGWRSKKYRDFLRKVGREDLAEKIEKLKVEKDRNVVKHYLYTEAGFTLPMSALIYGLTKSPEAALYSFPLLLLASSTVFFSLAVYSGNMSIVNDLSKIVYAVGNELENFIEGKTQYKKVANI